MLWILDAVYDMLDVYFLNAVDAANVKESTSQKSEPAIRSAEVKEKFLSTGSSLRSQDSGYSASG